MKRDFRIFMTNAVYMNNSRRDFIKNAGSSVIVLTAGGLTTLAGLLPATTLVQDRHPLGQVNITENDPPV